MNAAMERFIKAMARVPKVRHVEDVKRGVPEATELSSRAWVLAQVDSTPESWRKLEEAIEAYLAYVAREDAASLGSAIRAAVKNNHEAECDCASCRPWTS